MTRTDLLRLYQRLGLTLIPLNPRSKAPPLVKWRNGWEPTPAELEWWLAKPGINWGARCGPELAAMDFDTPDAFYGFLQAHPQAISWPRVRTGRGFHLWVRLKKPIRSQRVDCLEVKCLGSYVVAPPSIHPSGAPYTFEIAPDGALPEVDLEELLGLSQIDSSPAPNAYESIRQAAPSDFALRYGKSAYPRSLCGLATKVLTRSDGKVKHLVSMRDWKWDCPKCAPLLKRYWMEKLRGLSFRFILRLPNEAKPTKFLRRAGRPGYAHIVDNGESWLFLIGGEAKSVWAEAHKVGYELIVGDVAGDPTPEQIKECLEQALCREDEPLNTRRKVTHSRRLFNKPAQDNSSDESKQTGDCGQESGNMSDSAETGSPKWHTEVLMEPIEEVARKLEKEGWRIFWKSEAEAIAIRADASENQSLDIVELMENLGIKLKKTGNEYSGLCPFHDDHNPSLSVNREKGLWHCFGCERGGDYHAFLGEWQRLTDSRGFRQSGGG
ncbi:MAG: bifunctional DNA primase/polymerase [Chloroflexota bacterium]